MMGYAGMALQQVESSGPVRESIQQIIVASERAARLTQQMLVFSAKAKFNFRPVNLSSDIEAIEDLLTASISKKVKLDFDLATGLPAIEADPGQIQQLVMNLVLNGAEACGDNPGSVLVKTSVANLD